MSSPIFAPLRDWWRRLDHGQQISLSILAPCALLTIGLALVSLQASVSMPFRAPKALLSRSDELLARQRAAAAQQDQAAGNKDTDGDGLTDADELRGFQTSPYLADTDSDGVPDGEEVRLGTDPNCPANKDCYDRPEIEPDAVPGPSAPAAPTSTLANADPLGSIEPPQPPETLTPAQIRDYLVRNRLATAGQVNGLPDDAVLELYRRAYADLEQTRSSASPPTPGPEPVPAATTPSAGPSQPSTP